MEDYMESIYEDPLLDKALQPVRDSDKKSNLAIFSELEDDSFCEEKN